MLAGFIITGIRQIISGVRTFFLIVLHADGSWGKHRATTAVVKILRAIDRLINQVAVKPPDRVLREF